MRAPPSPANERQRLRALYACDVLDTPQEEVFDRFTRLARHLTGAPIAFISLIDAHRQWFKSVSGLDLSETPRDLSFCAHTITRDVPMVVENALEDPRFCDNPFVVGPPYLRFYAGFQLASPQGYNLGTLCVIDDTPRRIAAHERHALRDLAALAVRELEFRRLASTDPLTRAFNRRMLERLGKKEIARAARQAGTFSFAMLDLDRFKAINDTHGHDEGDRVLRQIAETCFANLRAQDTLFRLGGEEFGLMLVDATPSAASAVIERVRGAIEQTRVELRGTDVPVTISAGIAHYDAETPDYASIDQMLRQADRALYRAKQRGRNRVEAANG